mmetsp:Transcript_421/g.1030  ORF Transcript_421/g.1030 Transcript_421/m.1030 type:complete len:227 (-) Transcript_421:146-826(-)
MPAARGLTEPGALKGAVIRGLLLGSSRLGDMRGRLTPALKLAGTDNGLATTGRIDGNVGVEVVMAAAPPQAFVFSHCAMYCSRAAIGSVLPLGGAKLVMTYRRLGGGSSFASSIFVLASCSLCFMTNRLMSRSSARAPAAAGAAAVVVAGSFPATSPPGLARPPSMAPGSVGLTPPSWKPGGAFGTSGTTTSSSGMGSGAPASLRCASMSCRSVSVVSSRHIPPLQ